MTVFAGETIRISTTLTDFDAETALTDADVVSVKVVINRKVDDTEVLAETDMTYDTADGKWIYDWNTGSPTLQDVGTYIAKVTAYGLSGKNSWEFKRFRLNRNQFGGA